MFRPLVREAEECEPLNCSENVMHTPRAGDVDFRGGLAPMALRHNTEPSPSLFLARSVESAGVDGCPLAFLSQKQPRDGVAPRAGGPDEREGAKRRGIDAIAFDGDPPLSARAQRGGIHAMHACRPES